MFTSLSESLLYARVVSATRLTAVARLHRAPRLPALLCAALAVLAGTGVLASSPARAAEEPATPPLRIEVQGTYEESEVGKEQSGAPIDRHGHGSWTAYAQASEGATGGGPITFTSDSGISEGAGSCAGGSVRWSLPAENPYPNGGWSVGVDERYPESGWKYVVTYGGWSGLPGIETTFCEGREEANYGEQRRHLLENVPSGYAQLEALEKPVEVEPGGTTSVTRSVSWSGPLQCGEGCQDTITEDLTLTISVSSPGSGNNGRSSPPPSKGPGGEGQQAGKGGSSPGPMPKQPDAARKKEKQQAGERLGSEGLWAAAMSGAAKSGGALGALAAGLAQSADSTLAKDEQTVNDPPLLDVSRLAWPHAVTAKAPPCKGPFRRSRARCAKLRAAERKLISASERVAAVTKAQYTTISRQSGAISSGDSAAANAQAKRFSALERRLERDLSAQVRAGRRVAALLRRAHVDGRLTKREMAKGIRSLRASLRRRGLSGAEIDSLPSASLAPKATDILSILARSAG